MTEWVRLADRSLPLIVSHLWSSTIFLSLMLLVIGMFRRRLTAGAVFWLALIGIAKFAIPASVLSARVGNLFPVEASSPLSVPLGLLSGTFAPVAPVTPRSWPAVLVLVWAAIALLLIIRSSLVRHRLVALSTRTATPPDPREVDALARAKSRVGVRRSIDIARSALPEAPAVVRTLRPLIVLPARGCGELNDDELESLLCHECAHVARYDNLIARIESLVCALFWFHPLIWIAQRITVIERERACDEVVSGSADERDTYLAALRKFCHASIAPRLPGVSCMATAKLKERIDHVMNYETLRESAPGPRKVALAATSMLLLFTLISAVVSESAIARETKGENERYAVLVTAARVGDAIKMKANVSDRSNSQVISAPTVTIANGQQSISSSSGGEATVVFDARSAGSKLLVDVTISREGKVVQTESFSVSPDEEKPAAPQYTGQPIDLELKDADIRDLIKTFGQLTGMKMEIADDVTGRVSVAWRNVPWDEAFDSMLKENGLTYRIEGKTIHVTKK